MYRAFLVALAALAAVVLSGGAAHAAPAERVTRYDVNVTVHRDGTAHVREAITYDFGANARHGIHREILYRPEAGANRHQRLDVSGIKVTSPDAPARTEVSDDGDDKRLLVGDPGRTVTGVHRYVIQYDTDRVATQAGGGVRYAWNAVGDEWDVPISGVTVHLSGPAALSGARCFAGESGSSGTPCDGAGASGTKARFVQRELAGEQGLTVQAQFPAGSVKTAPAYEKDDPGADSGHGLFGWFGDHEKPLLPGPGSRVAVGGLLLFAALLYGFTLYRRYSVTRRPQEPGVPTGLTPGLAAYLDAADQKPAMVMSTVLDLARRGYLRIDEVPGRRDDWTLTRTSAWDPALAEHEQLILRGLFAGRDQVRVRELRNRFHSTAGRAARALEDEAARRGWTRAPQLLRLVRRGPTLFIGFAVSLFVFRYVDGWPFLIGASVPAAMTVAGCAEPLRFNAAGVQAQRQIRELRRQLGAPGAVQRFGPEEMLPYAAAFRRLRKWEDRITADGRVRFAFYSGAGLALFTSSAGASMVSSPSSGGGGGGFSGGGGGFSGGSVGGGGGGGGGGSW